MVKLGTFQAVEPVSLLWWGDSLWCPWLMTLNNVGCAACTSLIQSMRVLFLCRCAEQSGKNDVHLVQKKVFYNSKPLSILRQWERLIFNLECVPPIYYLLPRLAKVQNVEAPFHWFWIWKGSHRTGSMCHVPPSCEAAVGQTLHAPSFQIASEMVDRRWLKLRLDARQLKRREVGRNAKMQRSCDRKDWKPFVTFAPLLQDLCHSQKAAMWTRLVVHPTVQPQAFNLQNSLILSITTCFFGTVWKMLHICLGKKKHQNSWRFIRHL